MSASPAWLDLPTELAEKILEGLPLHGYARFAAVCRQWRAIQAGHRRRHAPSPPPMLNLPWLIPSGPEQGTVQCYSPLEDRFHRLRVRDHHLIIKRNGWMLGGWMLREDAVVNLVTGAKIPLPERLQACLLCMGHTAAVSPPPSFAVFVVVGGTDLFLFRDGRWTELRLPMYVDTAVASGGRLHCLCPELDEYGSLEPRAHHLAVVEAEPPSVRLHEMAGWGEGVLSEGLARCRLVESEGQVLLVREMLVYWTDRPMRTKRFQVFRPSLSESAWARVDSLGAPFIAMDDVYSIALPSSVAGLRRNCIYFSNGVGDEGEPWKVFDLALGTVAAAAAFPNASRVERNPQSLFFPSVDFTKGL